MELKPPITFTQLTPEEVAKLRETPTVALFKALPSAFEAVNATIREYRASCRVVVNQFQKFCASIWVIYPELTEVSLRVKEYMKKHPKERMKFRGARNRKFRKLIKMQRRRWAAETEDRRGRRIVVH